LKKKLLLISQHFSPEIGAAATRWEDYTQLLKEDYDITVLTSVPNYPKKQVFEGYSNSFQQCTAKGIKIVRVPTIPRRTNSKSRIINYFFFVLTSIFYFYKIEKPDYILVTSPPLTVGLIGIFYKLIYNIPMHLDVRDLWPESAIHLGELDNPISRKLAYKLKSITYSLADKFITPIPSFAEDFPKGKTTYPLINGISDSFIQTVDILQETKNHLFENRPLKIIYAGNHGLFQNLEDILYVAEVLQNEKRNITFTFIGYGSNKNNIKKLASDLLLTNVTLIDSLGKDDLIKQLLLHDVGLVSLKKASLFNRALPSKTFEYAGAGLMILSTVPGDLDNLVQRHEIGITVEPENREQLKNVLIELSKNPSVIQQYQENAFNSSRRHFKKSILAEGLSNFISN